MPKKTSMNTKVELKGYSTKRSWSHLGYIPKLPGQTEKLQSGVPDVGRGSNLGLWTKKD